MGAALPACPHCGKSHPPDVLKCPETDAVLDLEGRILDEKFRLVARLGTGGMAEVWLARNERVDRDVAIKLIRPDIAKDEEMLARFRNEARAAGRIGNPHICEILDLGQSPIGPYIVMELLVGQSLADVLAGGGTLPPQVAAAVAREALEGLEAAHRAGIVHRDLKPENLFLHAPDGGTPMVKIMDFGVSKFLDGSGEAETAHGILLGTPQYMAPEQVRGARHVDPRTDIWAMGAILFRALSGQDAFKGETMAASLLKIASDPPPPLASLAPKVPAGLVKVVERALSRNPDDRYPTAQAMRKALEPFARVGPLPPIASTGGTPEAAPTVAQSEVEPTVPRTDAAPPSPLRGAVPRRWLAAGMGLAAIAAVVVGLSTAGNGEASGPNPESARAATTAAPAGAAQEPKAAPDRTKRRRTRPGTKAPGGSLAASLPAPEAGGDAPSENLDGGKPTAPDPGDVLPEVAEEPAGDPEGPAAPEAAGDTVAPAAGTEPPSAEAVQPAGPPSPPSARQEPPAPSPAPPGTVRAGPYLVLARRGPRMPHDEARHYCEGLDEKAPSGLTGWKLVPLSVVKELAAAKGLPAGRYWTAANWKGKARTVALPGGRTSSASVTRKFRPLCAVRRP